MAQTLQFELVSPEKLVLSEAVEMVVVPGAEGNFGALPDHAPMLSVVRPGVIDVYNQGQVQKRIFVAGGFAEVTEQRCTILAEEAVPVAELSAALVEQRRQSAGEALASAKSEVEKSIALRQIAIVEAMQAAL